MDSLPGHLTRHEHGHLQKIKDGNYLQNFLVNNNKENEVVHHLKDDRGIAINYRQGQIFHQILRKAIHLEHISRSIIYH